MAVPHMAPYCASKFALVGLSDSTRAELDQYGIRVTTVCPGLMRTGSPLNADIKGQHDLEYAWFAIADSTPGMSISAERAARRIIEACRYGDPELTITLPAKLAARLNHLVPGAIARVMAVANAVLPGPNGAEGDQRRRGRDSESTWTDSVATVLTERAAVLNNEL
jgi:NAD(P)-dependent dehydrogenase (short-subunit alcohol dehydrogenase family)